MALNTGRMATVVVAWTAGMAVLLCSCARPPVETAAAAPADIPYSLRLDAFTVDGFPGLHSAVTAGSPEKLVVFGGRTNGMHGFPSNRTTASAPSFPADARNTSIYVLDLVQKKLLGQATVAQLPRAVANQFTASNTESAVRSGWLYVVGGYGPAGSVSTGNPGLTVLRTLPSVMAVDLNALASAVVMHQPLDATFAANNIATYSDPNLAVTGGDLKVLGNSFLLVFGHRLDGLYTNGGGTMQQQYTSSVRVFTMNASHGSGGKAQLQVKFQGSVPNSPFGVDPSKDPYHRRDLPVEGAIDGNGNQRIAAYGGVFRAGGFDGFLNPVYIDADPSNPTGIKVTLDEQTEQFLSQYDCPALPAYSAKTKAMYSTFLGGISEYYWSNGKLQHDEPNLNVVPPIDGLPFINSVSTLKTVFSGATANASQFLHLDDSFPPANGEPKCAVGSTSVTAPLLGAETRFVPADGPAHFENGVFQLDQIRAAVTVGYLIGGIAADKPYPENTCASNLIYTVNLDPQKPSRTVRLSLKQ
jgi:hypothetical protein